MNSQGCALAWALFGCPAFAALVAVSKAGWFTIFFALVGLAIGVAVTLGLGRLADFLDARCARSRHSRNGLLGAADAFLPMLLSMGAVIATAVLARWFAEGVF